MRHIASKPAEALRTVSARGINLRSLESTPIPMLARMRFGSRPSNQPLKNENENENRGTNSEETLEQKIGRLEAVLFLAKEPLSSRKLSQHANLADGTEARTLIRQLNRKLDKIGRAFRAEEIAGGFQLVTRSKFAPWLRRLGHLPRQIRLSSPAMETLTVVAYRQPINRAEIESVRGVACGEILNQLMDKELVRVCGRSEELGRPFLYSTTKRFLQLFGLRSLEEIPTSPALQRLINDSSSNSDQTSIGGSEREVEEESDVSVSVGLEKQTKAKRKASNRNGLRLEDDDYDYEDEDEDEELADDDEEEVDDDEFEDLEEEDDDDEDEEFEDDDELDDDEDEELDDDEEFEDDDDVDDDEIDEEDDLEEDEWEEVDEDADEEVEDDEWEEDWDDDEEWEEEGEDEDKEEDV